MNCPKCYAQTEERWLLTSTFDFCPVCCEDANVLAKKMAEEKPKEAPAVTASSALEAWKRHFDFDAATLIAGDQWEYNPLTHSFGLKGSK